MFLARFLENRKASVSIAPGNFSVPVTITSNLTDTKHAAAPPSVFAQSVLITTFLKAGKLVKRKVQERVGLE